MPLDDVQQAALLKEILARRSQLNADVERNTHHSESYKDIAGEVSDRGEESVADLLLTIERVQIARDINELVALESARQRLESKDFGKCFDCDKEIPFDRLMAVPTALRCVECQQHYDATHAHPEPSSL